MSIWNNLFVFCEQLGINGIIRRAGYNNLVVLMYHGIAPDDYPIDAWTLVKESEFKKQLDFLSKNFEVVSIGEALQSTYQIKNSRKKRALITFDDGYRSNYSIAFPLLKEFNMPATIFLATAFINTNKLFWFDKVIHAIQASQCSKFDLYRENFDAFYFDKKDSKDRWDNIQLLLTELKKISEKQRNLMVTRICDELDTKDIKSDVFFPLNSLEISEMKKSGLIEFGSHTHQHEILTQITTKQAEQTVLTSIQNLKNLFDADVEYFSYPNGDYNDLIIDIIKKTGIKLSFTTKKNFWSDKTVNYEIPRIGVSGYDSIYSFAFNVSGTAHLLTRLNCF